MNGDAIRLTVYIALFVNNQPAASGGYNSPTGFLGRLLHNLTNSLGTKIKREGHLLN